MAHRMNKNFAEKISTIALMLLILGCASSKESQIDSSYRSPELPASSDTDVVREQSRIIIYNARLEIESGDLEKTSKEILNIPSVYGGYIVSASNYRVVFRIPSDKFESSIKDLEKIKSVTSKNIYSEDVTDTYRDTELRLDNKLKARDRYLDLLKRAENVTAAVSVEKELERLNTEIETMKGRLKQLSHLARYSTITVSIEEETKPGPIGYILMYAWKGIKWLFVRN
jgi:hypothetical protein